METDTARAIVKAIYPTIIVITVMTVGGVIALRRAGRVHSPKRNLDAGWA
jgi:hypothetical protein